MLKLSDDVWKLFMIVRVDTTNSRNKLLVVA